MKPFLFGKIWFDVKMGILTFIVIGIWRGELKGWNAWRLTIDKPFSWNTLTSSISQVENLKTPSMIHKQIQNLDKKKTNEKIWNREKGKDVKFGLGYNLIL